MEHARKLESVAAPHISATPVRRPVLRVGAATDRAELEADRRADAVTRRLDTPGLDGVFGQESYGPTKIRRAVAIGDAGGPVDEETSSRIRRNVGRPLDSSTRDRMNAAFGAEFSAVRVHTGSAADSLSRSLGARAFTVGSDIFFADGEYRPTTSSGQHVLAHELAHTVQQSSAGRAVRRIRRPSLDGSIVIRRMIGTPTEATKKAPGKPLNPEPTVKPPGALDGLDDCPITVVFWRHMVADKSALEEWEGKDRLAHLRHWWLFFKLERGGNGPEWVQMDCVEAGYRIYLCASTKPQGSVSTGLASGQTGAPTGLTLGKVMAAQRMVALAHPNYWNPGPGSFSEEDRDKIYSCQTFVACLAAVLGFSLPETERELY